MQSSNNLQLTSEGYTLKGTREKRSDQGVKTFQEAGELQYFENNVENQLRHLTETFCQIFNDHNEILEILLKENPKKFIQKVLNYTAVDAKVIAQSESDRRSDPAQRVVIEVKFCKEIDDDMIEFTDLNDIKGFIPIKI